MNIFPIFRNGTFENGSVFNIATSCKRGESQKCRNFCIAPTFSKMAQCPNGLTVYRLAESEVIFGIRVKGYYSKSKDKNSNVFSPALQEEKFYEIIKKTTGIKGELSANKNETEFVNSIFHEIRKFNKAVKSASEKLIHLTKDNPEALKYQNKARNIFASSTLISMRLNTYDFETNPEKMAKETKFSIGVYKKFEKAAHILEEEANHKSISIKLTGRSHLTINAIPIFDLLPFVLLENAVKYSPSNQDVTISFFENGSNLQIEILNIGPIVSKSKIPELFKKKVRGDHAQHADNTGYGYGLYLAKIICDLHDISISITSKNKSFQLNGVSYSDFLVTIKI